MKRQFQSRNQACLAVWISFVLIGVALRMWLWWHSIGSNDVVLWSGHAQDVATHGLTWTYRKRPLFNQPPLLAYYASWAWRLAHSDLLRFARFLKIPALIGEVITLSVLWRCVSRRACATYAFLPAAILISGFHGNTDSLCAALLLVAVIIFDRKRFFLAGLLWSAALNVKLMPLILLPLPFLVLLPRTFRAARIRSDLMRFCLGIALGMLSFLPAALTSAHAMYENMLAYKPVPDSWGVMAILNASVESRSLATFASPIRSAYINYGRYVVVAGTIAVGLLCKFRLKLSMTQQCAVGAALFLLVTPGFGVQYVAFLTPLLCSVDLAAGALWGCLSGLFVGLVYWTYLSWHPLRSFWGAGWFPEPARLLGLLAWAVLAHFVWTQIKRAWAQSPLTVMELESCKEGFENASTANLGPDN